MTMIERLAEELHDRYRVDRELGAGGMATVYLAEDLRHRRPVALKVLRPELAAVIGAERFLKEVETTANLQHPHILPLHDSGTVAGTAYYVMPYVEGESLRDRLTREKQLPIADAVRIAREVGSALDYAHRKGIIHRDIKPDNILLHEGQALVADFGIALAASRGGGERMTETGLSLGTPQYMSPEQATADRDPDARSDLYSLACVLYEMLAGEPPFTGATAQSVLAKLLTEEPRRVSDLRKSVPPHVAAAVNQAMQRLPADRFNSAAEFAAALANPAFRFGAEAGGADAASAGAGGGGGGGGSRGGILSSVSGLNATQRAQRVTVLAGLLALSVLLGTVGWMRAWPETRGVGEQVVRAVLELPADAHIGFPRLALSRDGSLLIIGGVVDGRDVLMQRPLAGMDFTPIPGTEGSRRQSISPDGRWLVFDFEGMRRMPIDGGAAVLLDADATWGAPSWTKDGTLVYTRHYTTGLWRIGPDGGTPELVTRPDTVTGELGHWWPQVLPDGEHVLFTVMRTPIAEARLAIVSLRTGKRTDLLKGGVYGKYMPTGHLLFARGEVIFAVPFDAKRRKLTGSEVPVVQGVAMQHVDGIAGFDVSDDGTLVYIPSGDYLRDTELVWVDRRGAETPIGAPPGRYSGVKLSPDGRALAVTMEEPGQASDIWVLDLARGGRSRLTSGGGADFYPLWTTDGREIVYVSEVPVFDIYRRRADASTPPQPVVISDSDKYPYSFTPDGRTLLYESRGAGETFVALKSLDDAEANPDTIRLPGRRVSEPALSPDGRWLAYSSLESRRSEVYLVRYPEVTAQRRQVSVDGGALPIWTKGGREIVYIDRNSVRSVSFDPVTGELGQPELLFRGSFPTTTAGSSGRTYDVTPDGQRFVLVRRPPEQAARRVVVVKNFMRELEDAGKAARR
jgi:eukaryotic-like serine/threonine-protein kinase